MVVSHTRDAQGNVLSIYENGKQKKYRDDRDNIYYFNAQNELIGFTDSNGTNLFHWRHKGKLIFEKGQAFVCIDKIDGIYDNCAKSRVELTDITDENLITQTEVPIYGSDRIGTYNPPSETNINSDIYILNRSYKRYELKDHLGNVRVTVSDSKRVSFVSETLVFSADIKTYTDYYAFGMEMVGRNWSEGEAYRFGHNGQEKSKEVGEDNYTAEFWEYDSQVIRRFNTDPIVKEYESPYLAFGGNPIWFSDVNGDDADCPDCPKDGGEGVHESSDGNTYILHQNVWKILGTNTLEEVVITASSLQENNYHIFEFSTPTGNNQVDVPKNKPTTNVTTNNWYDYAKGIGNYVKDKVTGTIDEASKIITPYVVAGIGSAVVVYKYSLGRQALYLAGVGPQTDIMVDNNAKRIESMMLMNGEDGTGSIPDVVEVKEGKFFKKVKDVAKQFGVSEEEWHNSVDGGLKGGLKQEFFKGQNAFKRLKLYGSNPDFGLANDGDSIILKAMDGVKKGKMFDTGLKLSNFINND